MQELSLSFIFITGFVASFTHCIGMCGGFMGLRTLGLGQKTKAAALGLCLSYHSFRVLAYVILGTIFGLFGAIFTISLKARALLFFAVGALLVLIGLGLFFRGNLLNLIENRALCAKISGMMFKFKSKSAFLNFSALGFLNGFFPCGLVYYFLAMAILSQSPFYGALVMFVFGLSTMPAMLLLTLFLNILSHKFKEVMFKLCLIAIITNGIYLCYLGFRANV